VNRLTDYYRVPTGPVPFGVPGNWTLKFSDEFDLGHLDTSRWATGWLAEGVTHPVNEWELACYDPTCVSVSGQNLRLAAINKPQSVDGVRYPYSSGMINTAWKYEFQGGYFESRVYSPLAGVGIANWPAWWMDGHNWPVTGEIDIFEGLGGDAAYHFHFQGGGGPRQAGSDVPGDYSGWHVYGAHWQPGNRIDYYYDGKKVGAVVGPQITGQPMYLVLNYAVTNKGVSPFVPSTMQVDYVRVWQ